MQICRVVNFMSQLPPHFKKIWGDLILKFTFPKILLSISLHHDKNAYLCYWILQETAKLINWGTASLLVAESVCWKLKQNLIKYQILIIVSTVDDWKSCFIWPLLKFTFVLKIGGCHLFRVLLPSSLLGGCPGSLFGDGSRFLVRWFFQVLWAVVKIYYSCVITLEVLTGTQHSP